ncbi:MAG: hypothetical protein IKU84_05270 [Clostridia bacterium]|nr:hypothetical protein [Clostridia bacterium]
METIYTIPIHEAYEVKCGCPLCKLEDDLEIASLEYVMGAAMMEPDVRIETNRYGFCKKHFRDMLSMQKKLPLALVLESHTKELLSALTQQKIGKKEFPALADKISTAVDDCYVCRQLKDRLSKYYSNVIHLWLVDPEFKDLTREQEYFCPHHLAGLLSFAKKELPKKFFADFYKDHTEKTAALLEKLSSNVSKFAKSFDHRFANDPLGDAKTAIEDAIDFLSK